MNKGLPMHKFRIASPYQPSGDQGEAIAKLVDGLKSGKRFQTLKGVTGSGKTFSIANVIQQTQLPTLVISHNKTLAAQLYREFKEFFPENRVEYFVSYYDYYQPEAYVPSKDLYIEKDSSINDEIDRLRISATASLSERNDVIVVSTVSCIYGLASPQLFKGMRIEFAVGQKHTIDDLRKQFVLLQYKRNDAVLERSNFRIRGDVIEIFPAYMETAYRIEFEWDTISRIRRIDVLLGETLDELDKCTIYPAKHFVMPEEQVRQSLQNIRDELEEQHKRFMDRGKFLEAQRIRQRTEYDLEMLTEMGYCSGIENYSRQLGGRKEGERPPVLIDYFPNPFLLVVDESHVSLPQIRAMYEGDRSRKTTLVEFGFRLPSALDNRPLYYQEFNDLMDKVIYVSATPGKEEYAVAGEPVEQIIRPTGLLDPVIQIQPTEGQIEHLYGEIRSRIADGDRVLVTTLTKKMAEDLSDYFANRGIKVRYLHSEIDTFERVEILKQLRVGEIDVIVGINLLREGLDLPEVSLIAILDADKIGFLRSATSLIQTIGRAARNVNGKVIMYADKISDAMKLAIDETDRRRAIQSAYNEKHGITPQTIKKAVQDILVREREEKRYGAETNIEIIKRSYNVMVPKEKKSLIKALEAEMLERAKDLEFEAAALIRDEIAKLMGQGD